MTNVALVAGAGGIIGKALLEEIAGTPAWRGVALSRSRGDIIADLNDAEASRAALAGAGDIIDAHLSGGGRLARAKPSA